VQQFVVHAWRNLWRNAQRTTLTMSALVLGAVAILAMHSYRDSTFAVLQQNIGRDLVGNAQVHRRGFVANPGVDAVIPAPLAVCAQAQAALADALLVCEPRVRGGALATSAQGVVGVIVEGVVPALRPTTVVRGRALHDAGAGIEALIGTGLAEDLAIDVGDTLTLQVPRADSTAPLTITVVGVHDAGTFELNATLVMLRFADAGTVLGLGDAAHELRLRFAVDDDVTVARNVEMLRAALAQHQPELEVHSWRELMPELAGTIESKRRGQSAMDFIFFLIVALGVLNAMTMATYERTPEFGVMLALGTRPRQIVALVVVESLLQGVVALTIAVLLVAAVFAGIGEIHLDPGVGTADFAGVRLPSVVPLHVNTSALVAASITTLSTVVFGALGPAVRASRLPPLTAIAHA
jgi:ABC-type lipoprotein release transport system permease subunit